MFRVPKETFKKRRRVDGAQVQLIANWLTLGNNVFMTASVRARWEISNRHQQPGSHTDACVLWFSDLLAVPKHPYAAMENWGLSVFVEQKILLDPEVSSASYQMELTMVVVHEICHQVKKTLAEVKDWR